MLRQLARQASRDAQEQCDLCGEPIRAEHRHLLDLASRQTLCVCQACSILFNSAAAGAGARRLIPNRTHFLTDFDLSDSDWDELAIPVRMAFFFHNSTSGCVTALYPSPMGPTESLLSLDAWAAIESRNPILKNMESDVEALLINRIRTARDAYLTPIDECFRLVGIIRIHWKGLGGGTRVWQEIEQFFATLKARTLREGGLYA